MGRKIYYRRKITIVCAYCGGEFKYIERRKRRAYEYWKVIYCSRDCREASIDKRAK